MSPFATAAFVLATWSCCRASVAASHGDLYCSGGEHVKIAFVFPGQGSQSLGMLASFAGNVVVERVLDRASSALGQDLRALIADGPAEDLNLTINTQPAMLAAAYAIFEAWRAAGGVEPALVAGHSLGEYTALTAGRALTLEDAVRLVRFRATAMQEAVPVGVGAMAAVMGLGDNDVRLACQEAAAGEVVQAVNFNAPSQVVIAGHKGAVERACAAAKQRGAKRAMMLPVSAPFHSTLMQPAADRQRQYLASVQIAAPTFRSSTTLT
jgi:[acyl-carrier-protein] S-malonyltransferase